MSDQDEEYSSVFERARERYAAQYAALTNDQTRRVETTGLAHVSYDPPVDYKARYYRRWTFMAGTMAARWPYVKLGPLTVYAYSHGVGWTWNCGRGHELRWRRL